MQISSLEKTDFSYKLLTSPAASQHLTGSAQTTCLGHAHSAQTLWHWLLLTLGLEDSGAQRALGGPQPTYGAPMPSAWVHMPGDVLLPAGL